MIPSLPLLSSGVFLLEGSVLSPVLSTVGSRFKFNERRCDKEKKRGSLWAVGPGKGGFVLPRQTLPNLEFAF